MWCSWQVHGEGTFSRMPVPFCGGCRKKLPIRSAWRRKGVYGGRCRACQTPASHTGPRPPPPPVNPPPPPPPSSPHDVAQMREAALAQTLRPSRADRHLLPLTTVAGLLRSTCWYRRQQRLQPSHSFLQNMARASVPLVRHCSHPAQPRTTLSSPLYVLCSVRATAVSLLQEFERQRRRAQRRRQRHEQTQFFAVCNRFRSQVARRVITMPLHQFSSSRATKHIVGTTALHTTGA